MHCVGLTHKPDVKSRGRYGFGRYESSGMQQLCHTVSIAPDQNLSYVSYLIYFSYIGRNN